MDELTDNRILDIELAYRGNPDVRLLLDEIARLKEPQEAIDRKEAIRLIQESIDRNNEVLAMLEDE